MTIDPADEREAHQDLPIAGEAAPPRENGELVFDAPWQARLFGLTLDLVENGVFSWGDFQRQLIASVRVRDSQKKEDRSLRLAETAVDGDGARLPSAASARVECHYYLSWLGALEHLLAREVVDPHLLVALRRELAARPHGHDH